MNDHGGGETVKLIKVQLKVQKCMPLFHVFQPSSGSDWSLCWADPGPEALCLTPLH